MKKTLIFAAALIAVPAAANAGERSFTRDGVTYVYTLAEKAGRTVINGRSQPGSSYKLTIRGTRVSGIVGQTPVSFRIAKPLVGEVVAAR